MRDYGKISTKIWNSKKFGKVSDDAKLLYLYLHTCTHVNSIGCFLLKEGYATADMKWENDRYKKAIDSLCKAYLVSFDRDESIVRIINFFTFDPFTNPKHAQGSIKIALSLPDCDEKLNVMKDIATSKYGRDSALLMSEIDRLSIAYRNPEPEPEPEPKPESSSSIDSDDFDNLQNKLLEALGEDKIQPHGAIVVGPIQELISQGVDLDVDIIPTIKSVSMKIKNPVGSWQYFIKPILQVYESRISVGKSVPKPQDQWQQGKMMMKDGKLIPTTGDGWARRMRSWREKGQWSDEQWGPAPGQTDCNVPDDLLRKENQDD